MCLLANCQWQNCWCSCFPIPLPPLALPSCQSNLRDLNTLTTLPPASMYPPPPYGARLNPSLAFNYPRAECGLDHNKAARQRIKTELLRLLLLLLLLRWLHQGNKQSADLKKSNNNNEEEAQTILFWGRLEKTLFKCAPWLALDTDTDTQIHRHSYRHRHTHTHTPIHTYAYAIHAWYVYTYLVYLSSISRLELLQKVKNFRVSAKKNFEHFRLINAGTVTHSTAQWVRTQQRRNAGTQASRNFSNQINRKFESVAVTRQQQ